MSRSKKAYEFGISLTQHIAHMLQVVAYLIGIQKGNYTDKYD